MSSPLLPAGIKEEYDLACSWIDARQIRTLVQVAAVAGESQIRRFVAAVMLPGYDVLDVESPERRPLHWQAAILAAPSCPFAHQATKLRIHHDAFRRASSFLALDCRIEIRSIACTQVS